MQYILETKPPEKCFPCHHEAADAKNTGALCYFRIWMRRDNVEFESEIRMFSRFAAEDSNNEIDAATERDKKRKELDKDNEYTSTPTCTNIEGEAQGKEEDYDEYVIADKEKIAFWTGNDQKRRKPESLLTTPISRFSRDKCLSVIYKSYSIPGYEDTVSPEFIDDPTGEVTSKKVDALATDLKHRFKYSHYVPPKIIFALVLILQRS
ncbi:unnamed protein product [Rhizophagus irregularis]|nr:unnamed protein product [Rhizophagus irregularis]